MPEMVWSKLETKLRTFEPPTTDLLFTGPAGPSHHLEETHWSVALTTCRRSHSPELLI